MQGWHPQDITRGHHFHIIPKVTSLCWGCQSPSQYRSPSLAHLPTVARWCLATLSLNWIGIQLPEYCHENVLLTLKFANGLYFEVLYCVDFIISIVLICILLWFLQFDEKSIRGSRSPTIAGDVLGWAHYCLLPYERPLGEKAFLIQTHTYTHSWMYTHSYCPFKRDETWNLQIHFQPHKLATH